MVTNRILIRINNVRRRICVTSSLSSWRDTNNPMHGISSSQATCLIRGTGLAEIRATFCIVVSSSERKFSNGDLLHTLMAIVTIDRHRLKQHTPRLLLCINESKFFILYNAIIDEKSWNVETHAFEKASSSDSPKSSERRSMDVLGTTNVCQCKNSSC